MGDSKEFVKIYCCDDCCNYNRKKHMCMVGATEEGEAEDSFYRDCPLGIHKDEWIGEEQYCNGYQKAKKDTIDAIRGLSEMSDSMVKRLFNTEDRADALENCNTAHVLHQIMEYRKKHGVQVGDIVEDFDGDKMVVVRVTGSIISVMRLGSCGTLKEDIKEKENIYKIGRRFEHLNELIEMLKRDYE